MIRRTSSCWRGMRRWICLFEHVFGRRWTVYSGMQNLLNQPLQAGKTPILTLGAPITVMGGVRFSR